MNPDELAILDYLKPWPGQFVAAQQICRQADGRRRFETDPKWAYTPLNRLVESGQLQSDGEGRFRLPPAGDQKPVKQQTAQWMSPKIRSILESRGKLPDQKDSDP